MAEELKYRNTLEGYMISDFIGKKEFYENQNIIISTQNNEDYKKFNIKFEEESILP